MDLRSITLRIARVGLHGYEEPCISGRGGSGTVFFTGCDMRCPFCQNYEISRGGKGVNVNGEELLYLMESLAGRGAENINLVTPTIWTNRLIPILEKAKTRLKIPFVWNSGGTDGKGDIAALKGLVDVWLPDFKYSDTALAQRYGAAADYPARASAALSAMRAAQTEDIFDGGMMKQGVIVRHLVLPDAGENTRGVMRMIADVDKTLYVSVMGQYFPTPSVSSHPSLGRRLNESEYDDALNAFFAAGLSNGFAQELDSATEEYVPDFNPSEVISLLSECGAPSDRNSNR